MHKTSFGEKRKASQKCALEMAMQAGSILKAARALLRPATKLVSCKTRSCII
jgi:hypothetical protein